ncbi:MAG: hypothetical protein LBB17_02645 [Puniceicoccales bacterium]|jgi:hypothetical protein|nr:hypothetical protein [Puniceicoccales bacterium]
MEKQVQRDGGGPVLRRNDQEAAQGKFGGFSVAATPDGTQGQSDAIALGSLAPGVSLENRTADITVPASHPSNNIPHQTFALHPSHVGKLHYSRTQTKNLNACGMYVLNHFVRGSIFGSKDAEDAHILYECFTEGSDLVSKLRSIREKLRNEDSFSQKLTKLDHAVAAITAMGQEGEDLLKNDPLKRHTSFIQDISDCINDLDFNALNDYKCGSVWKQLRKSFSPSDRFDPVVLRIVLERQAGVVLHTESGPGREITDGPQADASTEKKDLLEALKKNELPNDANRAIIYTGSHFVCVQKRPDGQWVSLDSNGPRILPEGSLAQLLLNCPHYQVMYCPTAKDQQKLEDFIARMGKHVERRDAGSPAQNVRSGQKRATEKFNRTRVAARTFPIHPSHPDELYFETQIPGSNTCGIHALNHFFGKPIFGLNGLNDVEGSHILYRCFTEGSGLLLELRSIQENLVLMRSLFNDDEKGRKAKDLIDQKLAKLDHAIAAITAMGQEGEDLLKNDPLKRHTNSMRDISDCIHDLNSWQLPNLKWSLGEQVHPKFDEYLRSIQGVSGQLQGSLSPADGLDPVALRIAVEKQAGITLHVESGPRREITDGPRADADVSQEKRDLLEALRRNELPNGGDRAIIDTGSHFRCVRKLPDGQWVELDSAKREGPTALPEGGLVQLLSEYPSYQIMYCESAEDQRRLKAFIANAQ